MKGAIGNAFILNMVIIFMVVFYMLLISSMAYSKAYKVKNYLLNSIVIFDDSLEEDQYDNIDNIVKEHFDEHVNEYLGKIGYILSEENGTCPNKNGFDPKDSGYKLIRDTRTGSYNFCIYRKNIPLSSNGGDHFSAKYLYKVVSYMKFDFPVIGNFIKVPLSGESKIIVHYK